MCYDVAVEKADKMVPAFNIMAGTVVLYAYGQKSKIIKRTQTPTIPGEVQGDAGPVRYLRRRAWTD